MKVEIFRRTVKDRRRGASWDLLQYMAEGIRACGDEPIIVNENMTGAWRENEMEPTAPIGCMATKFFKSTFWKSVEVKSAQKNFLIIPAP